MNSRDIQSDPPIATSTTPAPAEALGPQERIADDDRVQVNVGGGGHERKSDRSNASYTSRLEAVLQNQMIGETTSRGTDYFPIRREDFICEKHDPKLIAFYLPQFHPIRENNRWWGKGFTEWTNVAKARPQFIGHYQPHLPGELGFYDLRLPEVQRRQIELAKKYGIYGFCFHYYWFGGKALLKRPLEQFLNDSEMQFRFCLCWANENWTRRWDGWDDDVLIAQSHSPEDDIEFIRSIEPALRDPRYIRVGERPLLIVYRPMLMPEPRATVERWREYCAKVGIGDIYLAVVQGFGILDPRPLGFDAAIEFPPHKLIDGAESINSQLVMLDPNYRGMVFNYKHLIESAKKVVNPEYTLFRGVCPSWDNHARRPQHSWIFAHSTPELYEQWLAFVCERANSELAPDERFVFVNAWNEWGEGCHLEPDSKYGYAYLQATADALCHHNKRNQVELTVVFVAHDAARAGAQRLLLTLIRWLQDNCRVHSKIILRESGALADQFRELGPVLDLAFLEAENLKSEVLEFCRGSALAYINTLVPGDIAEMISELHLPIITHVHEMEKAIRRWCDPENLTKLLTLTDHFIAAAPYVADNLQQSHGVPAEKISTIYEFISTSESEIAQGDRASARREKGLTGDGFIVFGCGTTDWRKGSDLFVEVARNVISSGLRDVYFYWIGGDSKAMEPDIARFGIEDRVRFVGEVLDPLSYFAGGDVFLSTSREDPFPLACLEAADCGLPIICFEGVGGMPEFVKDDAGYVVPFEQTDAMAEKLCHLYANREEVRQFGEVASERVRSSYDVSIGGRQIFDLMGKFANPNHPDILQHDSKEPLRSGSQANLATTVLHQSDRLAETEDQIAGLEKELMSMALELQQLNTERDLRTEEANQFRIQEANLGQQVQQWQGIAEQKEQQRASLDAELSLRIEEESRLIADIDSYEERLSEQGRQIFQLAKERSDLSRSLENVQIESRDRQEQLEHYRAALKTVHGSLGWLATTKFRTLKNRYLIAGTWRRRAFDSMVTTFKRRLSNRGDPPIP